MHGTDMAKIVKLNNDVDQSGCQVLRRGRWPGALKSGVQGWSHQKRARLDPIEAGLAGMAGRVSFQLYPVLKPVGEVLWNPPGLQTSEHKALCFYSCLLIHMRTAPINPC
jgi:hypothetical protein